MRAPAWAKVPNIRTVHPPSGGPSVINPSGGPAVINVPVVLAPRAGPQNVRPPGYIRTQIQTD